MTEELGRGAKEDEGIFSTSSSATDEFPRDIALLLSEIEREPLPARLLMLAEKLQAALVERRQNGQQSK